MSGYSFTSMEQHSSFINGKRSEEKKVVEVRNGKGVKKVLRKEPGKPTKKLVKRLNTREVKNIQKKIFMPRLFSFGKLRNKTKKVKRS